MGNIDWKEIHKILGCKGCIFAVKKDLNKNACCTWANARQDPETGKCTERRSYDGRWWERLINWLRGE
jgi:hypothetical protein